MAIELRIPVSPEVHRLLLIWCHEQAELQGRRRVSIREAVGTALEHLFALSGTDLPTGIRNTNRNPLQVCGWPSSHEASRQRHEVSHVVYVFYTGRVRFAS